MKKAATVDEYIAATPEPWRKLLLKVRTTIRTAAPKEATEAIRWGMPTFQYKGQLAGYAAFTRHCSLFPMSLAVIGEFREELAGHGGPIPDIAEEAIRALGGGRMLINAVD